MKTKSNLSWAALTLAVALSFTACKKESANVDSVDGKQELAVNTQAYTANFTLSNTFAGQTLQAPKAVFTNKATKQTFTVTGKEGETSITAQLPQGEYSVEISGYIKGELNGRTVNRRVSAVQNVQPSFRSTAAQAVALTLSTNPYADFKIEEVFFTGTATTVRDQYFRIKNTAGVDVPMDGLVIAEGSFVNTQNRTYTPDVYSTDFAVNAIYQIPTDALYDAAPGQSVIIADRAQDLSATNPASRDLTIANFEWYDNHAADVDNPLVPNLHKIFSYTASIWVLHNRGQRSYVIGQLGTTEADFLANYQYAPTYLNSAGNTQTVVNTYRFPLTWVADGINLLDQASSLLSTSKLWLHSSVDAGFTGVDDNASRFGLSVIRKKDVSGNLIDTDNSTNDFVYGGTTPSIN